MADAKICGLTDTDAAVAARDAGAAWVGVVIGAASPRRLEIGEAARVVAPARGGARVVAVLVDPEDALIDRLIGALAPDVIQLHGSETPERAAAIRAHAGRPVWKALGVTAADDLARAALYDAADRILLDAKPPKDADRAGGHGAAFDWSILRGWASPKPWILSGGLTPETVAAAIAATGATAVDVSSGVESAPGVKDAAQIARFIAAARAASAERTPA